ncbi:MULTISPECIES: hypothetical protein [Streptomyces]|uniref:Uncharacterized protein n=1 Tax=Streptomyces venezuelae (strain ATCC 10712 / CBS 650.69 / DSM 40230 / JCM 4526 / NBRC 13096 / PD 04745) TaxID=953739 RepID=F2RKY8_STRVP|nr:hypothetical protein [Streptomyces venezuelae]APE21358.1 hypothetical protein vnz_10225 [Streptomyces venezuelae]QER98748.1 hypothetical protein DEJ43_10350 [Streptomyces venezuelae ATCC 10712]CCA55377.1 hypothetical protein SVEN_2091 [Streptomyces venezuelae ATCC 10712]
MSDNARMADVVCAIAQLGYASGKSGIEIAEGWIVPHVEALLAVREARAKNPAAFPGYGEGTVEETARRIIARLLDAVWRPPDGECLDLPEAPGA